MKRAALVWAAVAVSAAWCASLSDLKLERVVNLRGETHHVQGIDTDGEHLWVTSVDSPGKKGFLMEFALGTGERLRQLEVSRGARFHPGGIAIDGASLWLPVAEYRRASSSVIQKRNLRTLEVEQQFEVADHIGCVAASGGEVVGGNWDSREFYVWDRGGRILRKTPNPAAVAYQDIKFIDGVLVASGLLGDRSGVVDWLEYSSLQLRRRLTGGRTDRGVPYNREGMAVRGNQLLLLPEDSRSRLFVFRLIE